MNNNTGIKGNFCCVPLDDTYEKLYAQLQKKEAKD